MPSLVPLLLVPSAGIIRPVYPEGFPPLDAIVPLSSYVGIGLGLTARRADRAVPIELTWFLAVIWVVRDVLPSLVREHERHAKTPIDLGGHPEQGVVFRLRVYPVG